MFARRTYDFVGEPSGEVYEQLLDAAIDSCSIALLVTRSNPSDVARLVSGLSAFIVSTEVASEWPGTRVLPLTGREPNTATVRTYRYSSKLAARLKSFSRGLYDWKEPSRPEDLALLREEGNLWLGSVGHERDGWLELTDAEHRVLTDRIPGLTSLLGPPRTTGTEMPSNDRTWAEVVKDLEARTRIPATRANAALLDGVASVWENVVVARTSMHDLLFTRPGDRHPFRQSVRVRWVDDVFEFKLQRDGLLVTADRCLGPASQIVLESFLAQLAGRSSPV